MQNFVNMPVIVSGLGFFHLQIELLWSSPPVCEGAVRGRFCMLIKATHRCKIMQIDSPHLETHSECNSYTI